MKRVLMLFRAAQETLEGENYVLWYVTISQVPARLAAGIRLPLEHHLDSIRNLDSPAKKLDTHALVNLKTDATGTTCRFCYI
jgi:hypothetical protein